MLSYLYFLYINTGVRTSVPTCVPVYIHLFTVIQVPSTVPP
jgi:hypothetical protein